MPFRRILISGATGFVGRKLLDALASTDHVVSGFFRGAPPGGKQCEWLRISDLAENIPPNHLGASVDLLIHLASPLQATSSDPQGKDSEPAAIARNIAEFVSRAGIPRVLVMGSVAASLAERRAATARRYGVEKLAADKALLERLHPAHQVVILRPPAVYGPGMQNSMAMLARLVRNGLPIPLGAATESRYYLSTDNLCSLVGAIASAESATWATAAGRIFEPSDGQAVSTRALIEMMGGAIGRKPRLIPVPLLLLRKLGAMTGRAELVSGAIDRLEVADPADLEASFGWRPIEQMPESLYTLFETVLSPT